MSMPLKPAHVHIRTSQTLKEPNASGLFHDAQLGLQECGKHIKKHPKQISCPSECAFLRAEPTKVCQFKCVQDVDCNDDNPLAAYPNPHTMRCEACHVAGCAHCEGDRYTCGRCLDGFDLTKGKCLNQNRHVWNAVYAVTGIIALVSLYYLIVLLFVRDHHVNEVALEAGIDHRQKALIRQRNENKEIDQLHLWTNLCDDRYDICGSGVMLHFQWQRAILVWSVVVTLLFGLACILFWERIGLFTRPNSRESYDACEENVGAIHAEYNHMEQVFFYFTIFTYVFTLFGSVWLAHHQMQKYVDNDLKTVTIRDFALIVKGLPIMDGGEKVEESLRAFFEAQDQFTKLGDESAQGQSKIVGVSACWDYREKREEVSAQVRRDFELDESVVDAKLKSDAKLKIEPERKRKCCDPTLRCVDAALGIGSAPCADEADEEEPETENIKQLLTELKTCGTCYVIFEDSASTSKALENATQKPLIYEDSRDGKTYTLKVSDTDCEPLSVCWSGYGTHKSEFRWHMAQLVVAIVVVIFILDFFFYWPQVEYLLSYHKVPGMSQGSATALTMLGFLVTICNNLIYTIIGMLTQRAGWVNADAKASFYVSFYSLAVFFNTFLDMLVVLYIAQGYSVDQALQNEVAADSTMSAEALARPNMQHALYEQFTIYLVPGALFYGFIHEPITLVYLPQLLYKSIVGSRGDISVKDAEDILEYPPFDLSRYGDILCNVGLCCSMLLFTHSELWWMFFMLVLSNLFLYAWDHVKVLRFSSKTIYPTSRTDDSMMYMMCLPGGVLASAIVFKRLGIKYSDFANLRFNVVTFMLAAFFAHCVLHVVLIKLIRHWSRKQRDQRLADLGGRNLFDSTYKTIAKRKPANYFNTNPVHCLRSKHFYKHTPECVFYRVGKESQLKRNEAIGLYFTPHEAEEQEMCPGATTYEKIEGAWSKFVSGAVPESVAEYRNAVKRESM